jgi:hypothetical protein
LLAQPVEARLEGGHAFLEPGCFEVAGFEGPVVAGEGTIGAARLLGEGAALFRKCPLRLLGFRRRCFERVADEGAVAVEGGELAEYGGFEFVAGDALAVAGFAAELLSARAGVVVVEAAVSPRARADIGAAAAAAADEPGEEVVAGVAAPQRHVLAALAQQALRALEGEVVDEWFVQAWKAFAAPEDAAEVGPFCRTSWAMAGCQPDGGAGACSSVSWRAIAAVPSRPEVYSSKMRFTVGAVRSSGMTSLCSLRR